MGIRLKKLKCVCILKTGHNSREYIDVNGADLSRIDKLGFIDFEHKSNKSPNFIMGEPTNTKIIEDKIYSDLNFYTDNTFNHNIEFIKMLKPAIQGNIIEREGNIIKKFKLTGIGLVLDLFDNGVPRLKEYIK